MKQNLGLLTLLVWIGLLQPDGFAERTLVMGCQGLKPIELFRAGNQVVVADGGELQPYSITHTMSYVADSFIKIQIKDICVCAAPHQKFYSYDRNDWVSANALRTSEQLLCSNGNIVRVDAIETVHKKQKMHAFSVETSHIFCVTPYEIIAHNIDPVTTIGTVAVLSVTCPPAAIVVAVGQAVAFSVVACVMFCKHRRTHRNQIKFEGCFSSEVSVNGQHDSKMPMGCYHPVPDMPAVCDIKAGKEIETAKIIPYVKPEIMNDIVVCKFPIEVVESPLYHVAINDDCDESKRYEGPWYHRTEDWINEHAFGQKIKKSLMRTDYTNQGKRVFKISENIEGCDGVRKGDFVVVDAMHKDHLEVFNKRGQWVGVANFDGTKNHEKTKQGEKEPRDQLN